ncbi:MAG: hypothetical protein AB1641_26320 [Thermodesulfobacteriota bacterium]
MKKAVLISVLTLTLGWWIGTAQVLAADAAMVVDLSGQAKFEGGAKAGQEVNLMDFLAEGDKLVLAGGAKLILNYFATGQRESVSGPGGVTIGASASKAGAGVKIETSAAAAPPPQSVIDAGAHHAGTVALRGVKPPPGAKQPPAKGVLAIRRDRFLAECVGPNKMAPLGLYLTASASTKPFFAWQAVAGAQAYSFKLMDSQGKKVFESVVDKNSLAYNGPELTPGDRYRWTAAALTGRKEIANGGGEFWVLPAAKLNSRAQEEEKIKKEYGLNSTEGQIGLAMLYQKYEMYDDAAAVMRALLQKHPQNKQMAMQLSLLDPSVRK